MKTITISISVHVLAAMVALLIAVPLVFIVGIRTSPYTYIRGQMVDEEVTAGMLGYVRWTGMYKRNCTGEFFRTILDSGDNIHYLLVIPDPPDDDELNVPVEWTRAFILPHGAAEGPALYRVRAQYWCNPLQHLWPIKIDLPDIPFKVIRIQT